MAPRDPTSVRLSYRRLVTADRDPFHALVIDPHVRRFLLDGQTMTAAWCADEVRRSDRLFDSHGVGLWLVTGRRGATPFGFCGFRVFEELGDEPQLLYAMVERETGQGYATEIARALLECARAASFPSVLSAVDAPNLASIRVLEKVGFQRTGAVPGAFGKTVLFRYRE